MHAFKTGEGVGWHEHHHWLFEGTEKFFRPGYNANLITSWLPALNGVEEKLKKGAKIADVGCGHGASTIIMARAYPNSSFIGFDYHSGSIERARHLADQANVGNRVVFEVASAKAYPGNNYDLVTFFDCLHDMGDPVGAARHVFRSLTPGGTWMIVEPRAEDNVEGNLQSGRQDFLLGIHHVVHAGVFVAGGRTRAGRAGGRATHRRGGEAGRLQSVPPRGRNAFQPGI